MGFDIYEEKVLSFSNIVMKQNRVLSYIFMGLYLLSVLKGMFTNLMKKLYPTQDKEYSAESFDKTGAIGMLVRLIIFIISVDYDLDFDYLIMNDITLLFTYLVEEISSYGNKYVTNNHYNVKPSHGYNIQDGSLRLDTYDGSLRQKEYYRSNHNHFNRYKPRYGQKKNEKFAKKYLKSMIRSRAGQQYTDSKYEITRQNEVWFGNRNDIGKRFALEI